VIQKSIRLKYENHCTGKGKGAVKEEEEDGEVVVVDDEEPNGKKGAKGKGVLLLLSLEMLLLLSLEMSVLFVTLEPRNVCPLLRCCSRAGVVVDDEPAAKKGKGVFFVLFSLLLSSVELSAREVKRFRGGLGFKAHRLLYHSTLGSSVRKKEKEEGMARVR